MPTQREREDEDEIEDKEERAARPEVAPYPAGSSVVNPTPGNAASPQPAAQHGKRLRADVEFGPDHGGTSGKIGRRSPQAVVAGLFHAELRLDQRPTLC